MALRTALTQLTVGAGLALTAVSAAVGMAVSAGAAPQDAAFLDRLQRVGITWSNPYAIVQDAYAVCRELDLATPHSRIVDFVLNDNPDLDWESAADYVVLAYMTYCPPD
jgi:hypothetical protein